MVVVSGIFERRRAPRVARTHPTSIDMTRHSRLLSFVLLALAVARVGGAQQLPVSVPSTAPACDYHTCALSIVPN